MSRVTLSTRFVIGQPKLYNKSKHKSWILYKGIEFVQKYVPIGNCPISGTEKPLRRLFCADKKGTMV